MPPPPYRADQVGSLIRPKYLNEANAAFKQWIETERDHREAAEDENIKKQAKTAEQKAIKEAITEQVKRGIVPITSGEFERQIFYGGFFEAIDGLEVRFFDLSKFRTDFPTNVSLFSRHGTALLTPFFRDLY
jgi:methionine synthase II (cobalamin-independent)